MCEAQDFALVMWVCLHGYGSSISVPNKDFKPCFQHSPLHSSWRQEEQATSWKALKDLFLFLSDGNSPILPDIYQRDNLSKMLPQSLLPAIHSVASHCYAVRKSTHWLQGHPLTSASNQRAKALPQAVTLKRDSFVLSINHF
jgi:hypothetical protein